MQDHHTIINIYEDYPVENAVPVPAELAQTHERSKLYGLGSMAVAVFRHRSESE